MYLAVCDDEQEVLDDVCSLLDIWRAGHDSAMRCKTFQSAVDLLESARQERFTFYLLDVMMPGMDGLETAREIRLFDDAAEIVFLSTSPGFAYESYGVRALNYLLKPVEREKLFALLDKLYLREQKPLEALTLRTVATVIRVPYDHISYVEVIQKHVYFHLVDGDVREVAGSLREFETALFRRPKFMRVHRSYIVNMFQVERLSSTGLRTFQGSNLPISRLIYPQRRGLQVPAGLDRVSPVVSRSSGASDLLAAGVGAAYHQAYLPPDHAPSHTAGIGLWHKKAGGNIVGERLCRRSLLPLSPPHRHYRRISHPVGAGRGDRVCRRHRSPFSHFIALFCALRSGHHGRVPQISVFLR